MKLFKRKKKEALPIQYEVEASDLINLVGKREPIEEGDTVTITYEEFEFDIVGIWRANGIEPYMLKDKEEIT